MARTKISGVKPRNTPDEPSPPEIIRDPAGRPRYADEAEPGSGIGPRHAAADPGSPNEEYGSTDTNQPLAEPPLSDEPDPLELGPPYAGIAGGAVGGSPAEHRSSGGRAGHEIETGGAPRESTIGTNPQSKLRPKTKSKKRETQP